MKHILFLLDPLHKLKPEIDTSLQLVKCLHERGHAIWACDIPDISFNKSTLKASVHRIRPLSFSKFSESSKQVKSLKFFDLTMVRKEPPFDMNYVNLTYLLDLIKEDVPVVNDPQGIRNANEKMSSLYFHKHMPKTVVTADANIVRNFSKTKTDLVLKPLDLKGGDGIVRISNKSPKLKETVNRMTRKGKYFIMAQHFIPRKNRLGEKRVYILNDKFFTACDKVPTTKDFRANLSLGGTYHPTGLTQKESKLINEIRPYLKRENIMFAGLDILNAKLLEINVTCVGGMVETRDAYPNAKPFEQLVDAFEDLL